MSFVQLPRVGFDAVGALDEDAVKKILRQVPKEANFLYVAYSPYDLLWSIYEPVMCEQTESVYSDRDDGGFPIHNRKSPASERQVPWRIPDGMPPSIVWMREPRTWWKSQNLRELVTARRVE